MYFASIVHELLTKIILFSIARMYKLQVFRFRHTYVSIPMQASVVSLYYPASFISEPSIVVCASSKCFMYDMQSLVMFFSAVAFEFTQHCL